MIYKQIKILLLTITIFEPDNQFMWYFTCLNLLATVTNLFIITFNCCFYQAFSESQLRASKIYIQLPIHGLFFLDLILKFNTGYFRDGQIIKDRVQVTKNYLRQFKYDIITILPWVNPAFYFAELIFFLRLKNLSILVETLSSVHEVDSFYLYIWQLLKLSFLILFGSHVVACFWFLLGVNDEGYSWVQKYLQPDSSLYNKYVTSLYWSVTTVLTVGYGDIVPLNDNEKIFTIFTMLIGCCLFGYVMSSIGMLFDQINNQKSEIKKEMKKINIFLSTKQIDETLKNKIRQYLNNHLQKLEMKHLIYSSQYIPMLSEQLKSSLISQLFSPFLFSKSLTKKFSQKVWSEVIHLIQEKQLMPDEMIDDQVFAWYFLIDGEVTWNLNKEKSELAKFSSGDHFNEWAFFSGLSQHYGVYIAKRFSSALIIDREKFTTYLQNSSSKEHQQFCQIQDDLNFLNNFKQIEMNSHNVFNCPQMRYNYRVEKCLRENKMTNSRIKFMRLNFKNWKTKLMLKSMQANALVFLEDNADDERCLQYQVGLSKATIQEDLEGQEEQKRTSRNMSQNASPHSKNSSHHITEQYQVSQVSLTYKSSNSIKLVKEQQYRQTNQRRRVILQSDDMKMKIANCLNEEQVQQVRRRRSEKLGHTDLIRKDFLQFCHPAIVYQEFMTLNSFDKAADFESYYIHYNVSNVLSRHSQMKRSAKTATLIQIQRKTIFQQQD